MSSWEQWQWREVQWLWLALFPILIWLWSVLQGLLLRQQWLQPGLLPWMRIPHPLQPWRWLFNRGWLWSAGWLLLVIALAGPRLPQLVSGSKQQSLRDVMVVLDLSRSMTATDISPSRLARSRQTLQALLRHSPDSRYGLILYGLEPHLMFPLTGDRQAAEYYLRSVEYGLLPEEGSVASPALLLAQRELPAQTDAGRAIIWISDGDVSDTTTVGETLQTLNQAGIQVIIYAVATTQGTALQTDKGEWLQHQGRAVSSALPRGPLQQLARNSGALYIEWSGVEADWQRLYAQGIAPLGRQKYSSADGASRQWQEFYAPFLYGGLGLILLSLIGFRAPQSGGAVMTLLLCLGLWTGAPIPEAEADGVEELRAAYQAYNARDYELAWQRYAGLSGYQARMGQAGAAYQMSRYGAARQQYVLAFLAARDDLQRAEALFHMANSAYQMGDFAAAVEGYADVLRYQPGHAASRVNLNYARELLAEVALFRQSEGRGAGRGPQTAAAEPGEDLANKGVTLGEDKTEPVALSWSTEERQALVIRGVEYAELASLDSGDQAP
ncbi:MAG: VWA domain-containing protein, partial [Gammaproteobacteria bacterium]|nr:VWA domain-containing protein [Gammaproteobacteria bacterium]